MHISSDAGMADGAETLLDSYYPQATQTGFFSDTNISMRRTITTDTRGLHLSFRKRREVEFRGGMNQSIVAPPCFAPDEMNHHRINPISD